MQMRDRKELEDISKKRLDLSKERKNMKSTSKWLDSVMHR